MLTISIGPIVRMSRKHNDYSYSASANGHSLWAWLRYGQQEDAICDIHGPYQIIRGTIKPVFC